MILWTIKLLNTAKKAIAGRKYPHQLAWATAFGLLLGIVPHGNLTAVALLIVVLTLKVNHAMVALTAIGTSFLIATRIDPYSHLIGQTVLTHPDINPIAVSVWQWPLIPWTDLNNTVVMGSSVIGIAALIPVFIVTYPLFRLVAPKADPVEAGTVALPVRVQNVRRPADARTTKDSVTTEAGSHQVVMVDRGHDRIASPHSNENVPFEEIHDSSDSTEPPDNRVAVETRIDVIRMKGGRPTTNPQSSDSSTTQSSAASSSKADNQPMDEALNYLLRQLRDSQQRSAA